MLYKVKFQVKFQVKWMAEFTPTIKKKFKRNQDFYCKSKSSLQ